MQTTLERLPLEQIETDAAVVVAFEGAVLDRLPGALKELGETGEVAGKPGELTLVHFPGGLKAKRLLIAGAGKREKFSPAELRKIAGAAVRHLKSRSIKQGALFLDAGLAMPENVAAAVEGAITGHYEPDQYKTEEKDKKQIERFVVAVGGAGGELDQALERGRCVGEAQNLARDFVNEPANRLTPLLLAERARQVAAEAGLECEVLDRDRMRQLGMGALLGVAQGSAEPPALVVLRYRPESAPQGLAHLGLVGKGVTFDTGGISIKPADGMEKMKYDMAGGAATVAAMRAIAQLKPRIVVTGLVPTVENMPGSRAQRPGDIVTTLSGKTVEVINTDAEGRLILADAITYARRLGCTHLVDAATLTGAIVVALGHIHVGMFANNDELLAKVQSAAKAAGERMWPMPLDDDYKEYLKSPFADLPNIGGRWGGAITAAYFLKEFAENTPWVHLDIAGTAWLDDSKPFMAKGPTGVAVRTFVNLAMNW
jgi:leucyl aminopeptidase